MARDRAPADDVTELTDEQKAAASLLLQETFADVRPDPEPDVPKAQQTPT